MSIELITTVVAGVTANLIFDLARKISNWYEAREKLKGTEETNFKEALAAESIISLGNYLDNTLGQFNLTEYAINKKVKSRVDLFLNKLEDYLGTAEEIKHLDVLHPLEMPPKEKLKIHDELDVVEKKLYEGSPWDALASLRRMVEIRLRKLAMENNLHIPERAGAGKLLQILRKAQIIPNEVYNNLNYSVSIANRAIHGHEVSIKEADEALWHARHSLHELGLLDFLDS